MRSDIETFDDWNSLVRYLGRNQVANQKLGYLLELVKAGNLRASQNPDRLFLYLRIVRNECTETTQVRMRNNKITKLILAFG